MISRCYVSNVGKSQKRRHVVFPRKFKFWRQRASLQRNKGIHYTAPPRETSSRFIFHGEACIHNFFYKQLNILGQG